MQPEPQPSSSSSSGGGDEQLRAFLDRGLPARGQDSVTARSDLWAHAHIAPALRDAALNLQGSDIFKKVKPPGDTTLYRRTCCLTQPASGGDWNLAPLAGKPVGGAPSAAPVGSAQLGLALALPLGRHALLQEAKGQHVIPPNKQQQPPGT